MTAQIDRSHVLFVRNQNFMQIACAWLQLNGPVRSCLAVYWPAEWNCSLLKWCELTDFLSSIHLEGVKWEIMSCSYENMKPAVKRNVHSWGENWICMCYEADFVEFSTVKFEMRKGSWNCEISSEFNLWLLKLTGLMCCLWEIKTLCRSHAPDCSWMGLCVHV